jgi:hypothetical protein
LRAYRPAFLPLLNGINVVVDDKIKPGATAIISNGQRVIYYRVGNTIAVSLYAQYAAIRTYLSDTHNCRNYVNYLGSALISARENMTADEFLSETTSPADFCGVTKQDVGSITNEANQIFLETILPVTGLMLAHEVSHHLLGHLPPRLKDIRRAREVEAEADNAGSQLYGSLTPHAPAAIIFDVLANARIGDPFAPNRRHDAAECRFLFFIVSDRLALGELSAEQTLERLKSRRDLADSIPRAIQMSLEAQKNEVSKCEVLN